MLCTNLRNDDLAVRWKSASIDDWFIVSVLKLFFVKSTDMGYRFVVALCIRMMNEVMDGSGV